MATCIDVKHLTKDTCQQGDKGLEEKQVWRVSYDTFTSPRNALTATYGGKTVPAYREAHPDDATMFVTDKSVAAVNESPKMFDVTVTYSIPAGINFGEVPPADCTNPDAKWDVTISVSGNELVENVQRCADGTAVANSSFEVFEAVPVVKYDETINVSFKTRVVDVADLAAARGLVNSDEITLTISSINYTRTFSAHSLKMGNVSYDLQIDPDGDPYWQVTMPLLYREGGWERLITDQGYYTADSAGVQERIMDGSSPPMPKATPTFLDGSGGELLAGSDAVELSYLIEGTVAFIPLLAGIGD
jgi:hypothetical protein